MLITSILYNVLSLSQPFRLEHIANRFQFDFLLLTGTGVKEQLNQAFQTHRIGTHLVIHFGWSPGGLACKSSGCAIGIHIRHSSSNIVDVACCSIQGRGGSIRLKDWYIDVRIVVGYPPPTTCNPRRKALHAKIADVICNDNATAHT